MTGRKPEHYAIQRSVDVSAAAFLDTDDSDDDDLYALHEEVGGIAQPFMAQSKEELVEALRSITAGIKAEVFHGSAPAPTTSVDYGDIVITAKFQPADWSWINPPTVSDYQRVDWNINQFF